MKTIARRNIIRDLFFMVLCIFFLTVSIISFLFLKDSEQAHELILFEILMGGGSILGLYFSIVDLKKPIKMVSVNEEEGKIYLHPERVEISVADIETISCQRITFEKGFRTHKLLEGTLYIQTKDQKYEFYGISNVARVRKKLEKIVEQNKK